MQLQRRCVRLIFYDKSFSYEELLKRDGLVYSSQKYTQFGYWDVENKRLSPDPFSNIFRQQSEFFCDLRKTSNI